MELLLVLLTNSIAPDTLFASSLSNTVPLVQATVAVPISWLIVVGIILISAIALAATARRSKLTAEKAAFKLCESKMQLGKELAEVRYLYQEAKQLASTDSVTGLHNHRYLQERFDEELKKAQRYSRCLSVLMIDIDRFKDYNDAFGHLAGDDALRTVSKLLKASVRSTDVVARYGGEEFVVLLLEAEKASATRVAEKIRARIDTHSFPKEAQPPTSSLTVSIGVATYPVDGTTKEDLLYAADMACYQGKREGKNRVVEA